MQKYVPTVKEENEVQIKIKKLLYNTLQRRNRASKLKFVPNHPHLRYNDLSSMESLMMKCDNISN
jgi:hypothetical protein